jgi:hypothetical protein
LQRRKKLLLDNEEALLSLLYINKQIMLELQQLLIKKRFILTVDCTCLLRSFLIKQATYPIQKVLPKLAFHWRGNSIGCPPRILEAFGRLQTLPALKCLSIRITKSLPLESRTEFFLRSAFPGARPEFCFTVAEADGFDQLCSGKSFYQVSPP